MYIPSIIIIVVIIALTLLWENSREKERDRLQSEYETERTRSKEEWALQYERYLKGQEKLSIAVVSAAFDCSVDEAKEKFIILKNTYNDTNFIFANSNEERIKIYEEALVKHQEQQ